MTGMARGVALLVAIGIGGLNAEVWHAMAGAQSSDAGKQALAFLTNEHWIHAGDSISWSFATAEIHTVTFLTLNQVRPMFQAGCPGTTPSGSTFDESTCVNSGPLTAGGSYTVTFPKAGNYKLACLVHSRMTGAVHVLDLSQPLPYDQAFYDRQANKRSAELLAAASGLQGLANAAAAEAGPHAVTAGQSALLGTGGGSEAAAVMRFLGGTTVVHVGDTVEWTNPNLMVVHTITFGTEPPNVVPPSPGVTVDPDGARHATLNSPAESLNSGFIATQNQETVGFPQWPLDTTRFRVTFKAPGTFNYYCALHDVLGMLGKVVVLP